MMKTIGTYIVYDNQEDAAQRLFAAWQDGKLPYLTALTQSGKTGCLIELIRLILDYCITENINKPFIIYACLLSDTNLKLQADKDIKAAFDTGYKNFTGYALLGKSSPIIKNIHHPDLGKFVPPNDAVVFTIFDEIQERTNKGGLFEQDCNITKNSGAQYHRFFSSATPYVYDHLKTSYTNLVPVVLYPGPGHYSMKDYERSARLRKGQQLFEGVNLSKWAKETFIPDCIEKSTNNGAGFVLIRNNSRKNQSIQKENLQLHIKEKYIL